MHRVPPLTPCPAAGSLRARLRNMQAARRALMRVVVTAALLAGGVRVLAAETADDEFTAEETARGQKHFTVHCARCHGMQGLGGVGPSLARPVLPLAPDLPALLAVIKDGIPGTGMPSTWMLPPKDRRAIAGFVRMLGRAAEVPVAGDPARGRQLFAKAACGQCHTVDGEGGVKGPDLSEVGNRRGSERLRRMLTEPGADKITAADGFTEFLPVRLTTNGGQTVEGLRVNEDGFTIQLRDMENRIHSFRKTELKEITKRFDQSIMPSFAGIFSPTELDDLVAYLATLRGKK